MKKIFTLFVAIFATVHLFSQSLISVKDGTLADWDNVPQEYVASCVYPEGATYNGLLSMKVYADLTYINLAVEYNPAVITDREWVPFQVFIDTDNSTSTGGYSDLWTNGSIDVMLETAVMVEGLSNSYNPAVFWWWGPVGGSGWLWTDPNQEPTYENGWGAIIPEGALPIGTSQIVGNIIEIQLLRELIPAPTDAPWGEVFRIGVDILQYWMPAGVLPTVPGEGEYSPVTAEPLEVRIAGGIIADFVYIVNGANSVAVVDVVDALKITTATIPQTVTFDGKTYIVTEIGDEAFKDCVYMTSATIPNTVTSIGKNAFYRCENLNYLSIPSTVIYDSYSCGVADIYGCRNLKTLIVPADFFMISDYYLGFIEDVCHNLPQALESLTISSGNMNDYQVGWYLINHNCKTLKHIDFSGAVSIPEKAFVNCYNLQTLALPSTMTTIPYMSVAECVSLQSITIPAQVVEIEARAFENCRMLSSVTFEKGNLTRIGNWAFYNCHELQNVAIPEGVSEIGHAAFYGCAYLSEMTLPSTVQEIADNSFAFCSKLKAIHVNAATPPTVYAKTFEEVNRSIPVYVPEEAVNSYKAAAVWQEFNIVGKKGSTSDVDDVQMGKNGIQKLLRNGQLVIIRDGVEYNTLGQAL